MSDPHQRKCWDCGNIAIHEDRITPWVNCKQCGSQDTRPVRTKKPQTAHERRCEQEFTRDVIFLLQVRDTQLSAFGDVPCIREAWRTESVWLDRAEAEAWGKAHEYRFKHGWRVYGVPSEGDLAKLLRKQDEVTA